MTYPEPTPETKPQWWLLLYLLVAFCLGWYLGDALLARNATDPTPAPYPPTIIHERPVSKLDTTIGLADIASDLYRDAKDTHAELQRTREEARRIISAMVAEIQRLQRQPKIHTGRPIPADPGPVQP